MGFPSGSGIKNPVQCRRWGRSHGFNSWVEKIPWGRKWQHTPVFLPGKNPMDSPWDCKNVRYDRYVRYDTTTIFWWDEWDTKQGCDYKEGRSLVLKIKTLNTPNISYLPVSAYKRIYPHHHILSHGWVQQQKWQNHLRCPHLKIKNFMIGLPWWLSG